MAYVIDGKDCMIAEWFLLAIAYAFVTLRLYTRTVCFRTKLQWSEILLIASAFDALGLIICDTLTFQMGVMDNYEASERPSKVSFASNYFYDVGLGLPKLSLLAFYLELPNVKRGMRMTLCVVAVFVVACYLTSLFDDTFFCGRDVAVQWSQAAGACSVFYAREPFILNYALGLSCYLVTYAISVSLLCKGTLKASAGVKGALLVGSLPIISGTVRFICLNVETGQDNLVYILSMLELALCIVVVSLPGLEPLLKDSRSDRSTSYDTSYVC
ncbi:hypothetical protein E8E11_004389 [Didymella keratinophila]|uniref:Rhodopsin domain-containing protein n=1 Tax=Didymella heteroderae TaxID=1769908 RepID=A0A9P4WFX5_9PLEO|nr:hypothetical protein E8E12_000276 [Didymella heteroderae]KAF3039433.1 hypothetical protein E8E11_004389 [Didymella keratinophila]